MTFSLTINCDNDAFAEPNSDELVGSAYSEVARILRDAAKHIENGDGGRRLMDSNGNRVGEYSFTD